MTRPNGDRGHGDCPHGAIEPQELSMRPAPANPDALRPDHLRAPKMPLQEVIGRRRYVRLVASVWAISLSILLFAAVGWGVLFGGLLPWWLALPLLLLALGKVWTVFEAQARRRPKWSPAGRRLDGVR